jgi:nucleoside-diphosphate-sugar epimerase
VSREGRAALVGHTGFVGGTLLREHRFHETFNSSNIETIAGRTFDLLVVAGAPAEKWKANADPARDEVSVRRLMDALEEVHARKVVLISTVDVFAAPRAVYEDSPVPLAGLHAYGRNRRALEALVAARFDATIVRLPGLYGPGLKKNVVFDFLHEDALDRIDSRSEFQFYDVRRLWRDVETALREGLELVHLPPAPVSVATVARIVFDRDFRNEVTAGPARYDMRTRHAARFGGSGDYIEDTAAELAGLAGFVRAFRAQGARYDPTTPAGPSGVAGGT